MSLSASSATAVAPRHVSRWLPVCALLALAVAKRILFWNQRPPDMKLFLEPWFAHIVHHGPVQAFAHPFSNYEPAYLYLLAAASLAHDLLEPMVLIKILSVIGTGFLFLAVRDLLSAVGSDRRGALFVLVLPSVAINDALLAQCDALWAGATVLALAQMIRGRTLYAMIWCGVAIAFKAQAAFMAPVIIGAMIGRRASPWQWAVPGAVFFATLVPPMLMGWPAMKLLTVYLHQASIDQLAGRLANPWMFGTVYGEDFARQLFVLGYLAAGLAAVVIAALAARNPRDSKLLVLLAALAGTALPFLLPKMLERYYFLGDVMTLVLALVARNGPARLAAWTVQIASLLTHFTYVYFFYEPWPTLIGAGFAAVGLMAMGRLAAPAVQEMASAGLRRPFAAERRPIEEPDRRLAA